MAIDKLKTRELLDTIDSFFDSTVGDVLPENAIKFLRDSIMGPALEEIKALVDGSRSPVMLLAGRSGHGKSSLINAMTGMEVAEVGDIKPTTAQSTSYSIEFTEQFSSWQVIDSRGFFETTKPDGAIANDPSEILYQDILKNKPDIIVHVISAPEVRNLKNDLELLASIQSRLKDAQITSIPLVTVVTKADTLGNPRQWPAEKFKEKSLQIEELLKYLVEDVIQAKAKPLKNSGPLHGYLLDNELRPGVIPVCSLTDELWNIDVLLDFIGNQLPESSLLEYYQSIKRKNELKKISSKIIKRFCVIASGIGASPVPLSDFLALVPLQLLMITIIGGLSCKPVSRETALEYLSAAGVNLVAASGVRYLSRQILKFVPFAGWAAAGSMAGSSTWAIGKAAEAFFFSGELLKLSDFKIDMKNTPGSS